MSEDVQNEERRRREAGIRTTRRGVLRRPRIGRSRPHEDDFNVNQAPPFLRYRGRFYNQDDVDDMRRHVIDKTDRPPLAVIRLALVRLVDVYYSTGGELAGAPIGHGFARPRSRRRDGVRVER